MAVLSPLRQLSSGALVLVAARALSSLGSAATAFALNVWVYKQTGSYTIFATLAIVTALPGLLFAPVAGVMVDRYSRKRLLMLCDAIAAVSIFAMWLASHLGMLTPWIIGAVSVVLALVRTLAWPATAASLSGLTTPEQRPRINGLAETLEGGVVVLSPLIGAMLLQLLGIAGVALVDILSYLACIAAVATISFAEVSRVNSTTTEVNSSPFIRLWVDCTYGFRWILGHRDLTRLLLFFALINLCCSVFVVAYTPYILSFASPSTLAACLGSGGIGTIVGGIAFATSGGFRRPETGVLIGAAMLGICMTSFGVARAPATLLVTAFFYGAALPLINASSQTIWQSRVPLDRQGRVFSVRRMIAWGLNPLSILLSIPLVTTVFGPLLGMGGSRWTLAHIWGPGPSGAIGLMLSTGGLCCLSVALVLLRRNGLRIEPSAAESTPAEKLIAV